MRLLVLGGTAFLGRVVAEAALAAGHELTLFNRGRTSPGLFPEAEELHGDRDGGLGPLAGRKWDAAVDTSGYVPRVVRASAELLRDSGHYTFVSSISAYARFAEPPREGDAVAAIDDPASEDVEAHYGALKALCEAVVEDVFGGRSLVVRPGLIVGPHDPTGRFTYWPHRVARGGEVLAPGPPERPVQLIDVRDLGEWIVRGAEARLGGLFNAIRPPFPMRELLAACPGEARVTWVDGSWLAQRGVGEWMELPLWLAPGNAEWAGFLQADASQAIAAGLTFRPLEATARGALEEAELVDGVGLTPEREAELLRAWHRQ